MIQILLSAARESNLTFDEVFIIVYDYGFIDSVGNITTEFLDILKE